MITISGDITSITKGIIVHQVNCQGKMASGVAKAISDKWPQVKESYLAECGRALPEVLFGTGRPVFINEELIVINAFTQMYYGKDGRKYTSYDAIDNVFSNMQKFLTKQDRPSQVYVPYNYGCGWGGGKWSIVSSIIQTYIPGAVAVHKP